MPDPTLASVPVIVFEEPWWLATLPVAFLAVVLAARGRALARRPIALAIRLALVTLIGAALARPVVAKQAQSLTLFALDDTSDSVERSERSALQETLARGWNDAVPGDRLSHLAVAGSASVVSMPATLVPGAAPPILAAIDRDDRDSTDLGAAVRLALMIAPRDTGARILLASDGFDSEGSLARAAIEASGRGIPIDILPLDAGAREPIRLDDLSAPSTARPGSAIPIRVVMSARQPIRGALRVTMNGEPIQLDERGARAARVELEPGVESFIVAATAPQSGIARFEAIFEPDEPQGDPALQRAEAVTFIGGGGRVLVVAPGGTARSLVEAMEGDDIRVERVDPAAMPTSLAAMAAFDAIVLAGVSADQSSGAQQEALRRAVHDLGVGLIMVGGERGFGAGGWIGSPVAAAMPLDLEPTPDRAILSAALAIVLDCSGSMSERVGTTGRTKLAIAADAARAAAFALGRDAQITVIGFSGAPEVLMPLAPNSEPRRAGAVIEQLGAGGGTNLFPAIEVARRELAKARGLTRHIIVLSDGATTGDLRYGLAQANAALAEGVTLSTVAVGEGADEQLMAALAAAGGGRNWSVATNGMADGLTPIFQREVIELRRSLLVEGEAFAPELTAPELVLAGFTEGFPAMTGHVVTGGPRSLATLGARSPRGDPLLAWWNYGLGRTVAFTSDAGPRWNEAWLSDPRFSQLWRYLVRRVLRPDDNGARLEIAATDEGSSGRTTRLLLELSEEAARTARRVTAVAVAPDGTRTEVAFDRNSQRRFVGVVPTVALGVHLFTARIEGGEVPALARAAVVRRAGEESRVDGTNEAALRRVAERTGGRYFDRLTRSSVGQPGGAQLWSRDAVRFPLTRTPVWDLFAAAAAILLLADVAFRRLQWTADAARNTLTAIVGVVATGREAREDESTERLNAAKARAQQSSPGVSRGDQDRSAVSAPRSDRPATASPEGPSALAGIDLPRSSTKERAAHAEDSEPGADDSTYARLRAAKGRAREQERDPRA